MLNSVKIYRWARNEGYSWKDIKECRALVEAMYYREWPSLPILSTFDNWCVENGYKWEYVNHNSDMLYYDYLDEIEAEIS